MHLKSSQMTAREFFRAYEEHGFENDPRDREMTMEEEEEMWLDAEWHERMGPDPMGHDRFCFCERCTPRRTATPLLTVLK